MRSSAAAPIERLFATGEDWVRAADENAIYAVTGPVVVEGAAPATPSRSRS